MAVESERGVSRYCQPARPVARPARDRETLEAVRVDEAELFVPALRSAIVFEGNHASRPMTKSQLILWFLRGHWPMLGPDLRDALSEAHLVMARLEDDAKPRARECVGERRGQEMRVRRV